MTSFSPAPRYKIRELTELPQNLVQGDRVIYYPGSQADTSILEIARASLSHEQFCRIKFVYQDPFYDRTEIEKGRRMGYPYEWSLENLDLFLKRVKGENIELIPTPVKGNDLAAKADIIYLHGLPLFGDRFPFDIMSNAKPGTYLIGSNQNLDEFSFLFGAVQQLSENVRRVENPAELSKEGIIYRISPEVGELMFEYRYNTRGYSSDGTIEMSPEEAENAMMRGEAVVLTIQVDLESKLRRGLQKLDEHSTKRLQELLHGEKLPKLIADNLRNSTAL